MGGDNENPEKNAQKKVLQINQPLSLTNISELASQ